MTTPIQITDILWNAQEKHLNHPDTFFAPSQDELATIGPGSLVKIGLEFDTKAPQGGVSAERFWIEVTDVNDTSIIGKVSNHLLYTEFHNLRFGDLVQFDYSAVMNVLNEHPE